MFRRHEEEPGGRPVAVAAQQLVVETEAFLTGRLVEALTTELDLVPRWAWMNCLAHGGAEDLRRIGVDASRLGQDPDWQRAVSFLANEVLDAARLNGPLDRLQRDVLVPLELELAAWSHPVHGPKDLVGRVLLALAIADTDRRPGTPDASDSA